MTEHSFTQAEAVFYAMRKTRDGTVVSFVLHPNELSEKLLAAPIGTRLLIAVAEISEDE